MGLCSISRNVDFVCFGKRGAEPKGKALDLPAIYAVTLTRAQELWAQVADISFLRRTSGLFLVRILPGHLPGNLGAIRDPPEKLDKVAGKREVLASLLRLLPQRPDWMDGWEESGKQSTAE